MPIFRGILKQICKYQNYYICTFFQDLHERDFFGQFSRLLLAAAVARLLGWDLTGGRQAADFWDVCVLLGQVPTWLQRYEIEINL